PGGGRGREGPAQGDTAALAQALEDLTRRLAELEERVDFAERMLAKERAAERLAPPEGERRA
ncbi:MAG TPA: hypothetical protein VHQ03_04900, partial [Candidatus Dormibacteraeota bacterium]|nr:hypothetical protein [Candidatus Dormibacteraeota bacterium]